MLSSSDTDRRDVPHSTKPLVSVVIPAFNASRYIELTLRSAGRQTYRNLEIIVINDGSTDDTAKVVEQVALDDSRIRLLSTLNWGVAAARNTGIQEAVGRYVAFLDADDLWHHTKIEKQVNALDRLSPQWAAVYVLHHIIDHDDEIIRSCRPDVARGYIFARHLTFKYVGNGSALLVRRDAALEIGGFDSSYAAAGIGGCEDLDFELRLAARYHIDVIPEPLVGYRQYPGNMSSNHLQMGQSALEVVRRSLAANPHLPQYATRSATITTQKYAFWEFRHARNTYLSLVTAFSISQNEPGFVVRLALEKCLRLIHRCVHLVTTSANGQHAARMIKSKFDQETSPSSVVRPQESGQFRRHLVRLTEVDAELSAILEPMAGFAPVAIDDPTCLRSRTRKSEI
ncbi:glycosyltransferase family 2 protein [Rhizobium laguerreae]|uniref:Glycosyltransferase family 2 protein n=1 Tax=Rhizobium laguerreae TaxID=1076926 RepID=A0AB35FMX3_9HYPH|nr:glycosyltransferase family 2 protein [Rhizobium laguerreae]MBY3068206.1 glycosyltransferase family 2 protein [Rhizobium laguerreae]MBY3082092.1 glycosyltransferase family 2 protein [Rhizobium laguerreae]MBY3110501.1 glycosyltransferase family 2 protein [Rhizobium laguerreae]